MRYEALVVCAVGGSAEDRMYTLRRNGEKHEYPSLDAALAIAVLLVAADRRMVGIDHAGRMVKLVYWSLAKQAPQIL